MDVGHEHNTLQTTSLGEMKFLIRKFENLIHNNNNYYYNRYQDLDVVAVATQFLSLQGATYSL